jgi:hypothetical protein
LEPPVEMLLLCTSSIMAFPVQVITATSSLSVHDEDEEDKVETERDLRYLYNTSGHRTTQPSRPSASR